MTTLIRGKPPSELGKLELWEWGRSQLGYGEWTEYSTEPYQKYAGMQCHRLFLAMRSRKASADDFVLCVQYCKAHHLRIENAVWVFKHYPEARKEVAGRQVVTDLDAEIRKAIEFEREIAGLGATRQWESRLLRAVGPYRGEVLAEWAKARGRNALSWVD